jgi:NADH dehydrogenase (ubiquinone) Fe-S protein 3
MATKLGRSRAMAQALRPARLSMQNPQHQYAARCFSVTARADSYTVKLPKDAKNMRLAERETLGTLEAPIVNPADKYQSKADNLHRYGSWLMGCLPKYIQQFSVWKDELTIYICPSGVIPVFSFLKCKCSLPSV